MTLTDTVSIVDNETESLGGGIATEPLVDGVLPVTELHDRSSVMRNVGPDGGGLSVLGGTLLVTDRVVVASNFSSDSGGGILLHGGTTTIAGNAIVRGNQAINVGGGIASFPGVLSRVNLKGRSVIKANIAPSAPAVQLVGRLTMSEYATIKGHTQTSSLTAVMLQSSPTMALFLRMKDSSRITGNTVQADGAAVGTFICDGGARPALYGLKGRVVANTPANVKAFTAEFC